MASDWPLSPPIVVLDANLLYPFHLRNLLVQFSVDGVHRTAMDDAHPQGMDGQPGCRRPGVVGPAATHA